MKFAHLGDCHLGSWSEPELKELNFLSFQEAIRRCLSEDVDFILIAGDLFDSAYPPIDTLKRAFEEFRKLKERNIPVFLIAGSHDYSVSGKTFLDVLEKAGFCQNVAVYEERDGRIYLQPTVFQNVAIYGFPGRKSGLEVDEISRIKLQDSPGLFNILMLHTAIKDAVGNSFMKAVDERNLPKVDYLALAHLHINYCKENRVYCGPTFPNNISEIEELKQGSFYIFDNGELRKEVISIKPVETLSLNLSDALNATDTIISELLKLNLSDKILILRIAGILERGRTTDINFQKIEKIVKDAGCYAFLKSTSRLVSEEENKVPTFSTDFLESEIISKFEQTNSSQFNALIPGLMRSLNIEKLEDETRATFEERLMSESKKVINEGLKNEI